MKEIIILFAYISFCHGLPFGPCHPVETVELDLEKWTGKRYVIVESQSPGAHCQWVSNYVVDVNGTSSPEYFFKHMTDDTENESTVRFTYVSKGYYSLNAPENVGAKSVLHNYVLHFDPPNLVCHFVCTDEPSARNNNGSFYCDSQYPDAPKEYAPKIKEIAERNGFNVSDLLIMDNCNCRNIPYEMGPSKCEQLTAHQYFS